MKISNLLIAGMALTTLNNDNQVKAMGYREFEVMVNYDKASCIRECVDIHSTAAKACSALFWNMPAYISCQLLASGALGTCVALCSANNS